MAQVTISGKLRYAYATNTTTTANVDVNTSGVVRTDGNIDFAATEDLGGGMKVIAKLAIATGGRDIAAGNRDGGLALTGGFGTFAIGSLDAGNGIIGLGGAGAPVIGLDGVIIPDSGNIDYMSYTSASINGLTFSVLATDTSGATLGMNSSALVQDSMVYGVAYSAGPLKAKLDVTVNGDNSVPTTVIRGDGRTRLSASYDLGVAVIGAGFETRKAAAANSTTFLTTKDTVLGVAVPMGALTFGVNYVKASTDTATFDTSGTDYGVKYDLSKRTYVAAHYQKLDNINYAGAALQTNGGESFRVQLSHAF
jgi:hypothetical protein